QFTSDESSNIDIPTSSLLETIDVNVDIETPSVADPNSDYPQFVERVKTPVVPLYPSPKTPLPIPIFNYLPPMKTTQAPAFYSCYQNLQITQNINVQNIFDLNSPQQTSIDDCINSQSTSPGYSFQSHHYPYQTIVINLRVNIYVQALTLGSQSNVQRYGLRLYNPLRNVDDTYYSSLVPEYGNQPSIVGIPLTKVAIRLYLNLYTTNDGRPPRNIKIVIHGCFDTSSSSIDRGSSGRIGGQYYRTPDIPQLPLIPPKQRVPSISIPVVNSRIETIYSDIQTPYNVNENSIPQYDDAPPTMMIDNSRDDDQIVSQPDAATLDINVEIDVPSASGDQPSQMLTTQAPAFYTCYQNLQITQNINVQNIFDLNSPQQT
ncbi:unnamed protein product, partial [Adineta steineri]